MSERLVHYAAEPVRELRLDYPYPPTRNGKPSGLWVSVETGNEDGWADWCRGEEYGVERLACAHEVTLAEDAHLLRLSNAEDLDVFTERFGVADPYGIGSAYTRAMRGIDWDRVMSAAVDAPGAYQGLIIAPYVWSRRMETHTFWYYGWDCASGCIWDVSAVAEIRLMAEQEVFA